MASQSKRNPTGFHGYPSQWAVNLANAGLAILLEAQSRVAFPTALEDNGSTVYIVPRLSAQRVGLCLLYSPKSPVTPALLASAEIRSMLSENWRALCRAYVDVDICPRGRLAFNDHNATLRAANELLDLCCPWTPPLDEIDASLGTSLALVASEASRQVERIIDEFHQH